MPCCVQVPVSPKAGLVHLDEFHHALRHRQSAKVQVLVSEGWGPAEEDNDLFVVVIYLHVSC